MTWNPDPEIAVLRDYASKFKQTKVILLSYNEDTEIFGVVTYGITKKKCAETKKIGDKIHDLFMDGTITFW